MRRLLLGLSLMLAAEAAQAQQPVPATCTRDLFQNEAGMQRELTGLRAVAASSQAEQCRVWRAHVTFLQGARAVFATCQRGREREQSVAQMDEQLAEYRALLSERCRG